jgi:hypothetical protein
MNNNVRKWLHINIVFNIPILATQLKYLKAMHKFKFVIGLVVTLYLLKICVWQNGVSSILTPCKLVLSWVDTFTYENEIYPIDVNINLLMPNLTEICWVVLDMKYARLYTCAKNALCVRVNHPHTLLSAIFSHILYSLWVNCCTWEWAYYALKHVVFLSSNFSFISSKVRPLYSGFPSPKTKLRHLSLSLVSCSVSPWFVMLRLTPSIHRSLGLPLLRVPSGSHSKTFSGSLFPGILFTCPNHRSRFSSVT